MCVHMKTVVVTPYGSNWAAEFTKIKRELADTLGADILRIEHVGSTSVEGLAAKPIIDIDIVIAGYNIFEAVKVKLSQIGYTHEGNLGIMDRHAFKYTGKPHLMKHHLYVCPADSAELQRHLAFRDYLRAHPADRDWYGTVKLSAAKRYPDDIDGYIAVKSPCVTAILQKCT